MKFFEGVIIGSLITVGATYLYKEHMCTCGTKKMVKKGKQFIKKMGLI